MRNTARHGTRAQRSARWILNASITFCLVAPPLASQGTTLIGSVRDNRGIPVAGAQILIRGMQENALTDADGVFRVSGVPLGITYVAARAPGVIPAVELFRVRATDSLEFVLERFREGDDTVAYVLDAEKAWARDIERYAEATSASRTAFALTRRDIAGLAPQVSTDLFRGPVGFRVVGAGMTAVAVASSRNCRPNVFIDGQEQLPRFNLNEIRPQTIKLLLAYNSYAILPPQLRSFRADPLCGTIAILTR